MRYILKEKVTDKMLVACGYEISLVTKPNSKGAYKLVNSGDELYIPLFNSIYGERVIQYAPYGTLAEDLLVEHIQDLIDLDYVEEVD